jgi:hypothetical protein
VVEPGRRPCKNHAVFDLGRDLKFSTAALESYAFARWKPVIYDAMILAAAVEYADRTMKRPSLGWTRKITLRVPVHDPGRWSDPAVANALDEALRFLTGESGKSSSSSAEALRPARRRNISVFRSGPKP